jgi:hypothetical protein
METEKAGLLWVRSSPINSKLFFIQPDKHRKRYGSFVNFGDQGRSDVGLHQHFNKEEKNMPIELCEETMVELDRLATAEGVELDELIAGYQEQIEEIEAEDDTETESQDA